MAKRRGAKSISIQDAASSANPKPQRPQSLHFDEDEVRWKWKRDTATHMTGGYFIVARGSSKDGPWTAIGGQVSNPASGIWITFQDVAYTEGNDFLRVYAVNNYLRESDYAYAQRDNASDYCELIFRFAKPDGTKYTGEKRPIVSVEPEETDLFDDQDEFYAYARELQAGVRADEYSGLAVVRVKRSSVINDITYKILIVKDDGEELHTGITVPDVASKEFAELVELTPA